MCGLPTTVGAATLEFGRLLPAGARPGEVGGTSPAILCTATCVAGGGTLGVTWVLSWSGGVRTPSTASASATFADACATAGTLTFKTPSTSNVAAGGTINTPFPEFSGTSTVA